MGKVRSGNVELLRFVFSVCIVCLHGDMLMKGGYLGVEFFFMLTGVFLARSLKKNSEEHRLEPVKVTVSESWKYVGKRIWSIYPYFIISCIIGFAVIAISRLGREWSLAGLAGRTICLPFDFLCWQNYGFSNTSPTGTVWYLSALFFALWLLYPIIRRKYDMFVRYIAPVLSVWCVGLLLNTYGNLETPNNFMFGFINTGFLRAIAMISLGAVINLASEKLGSPNMSKRSKWLISIFEYLIYAFILVYMLIWTKDIGAADGIAVLAIAVALTISVSGKSCWDSVLPQKLCLFLGRFSMVLFMNHYYWFHEIGYIMERFSISVSETQCKIIAIICSVISSLIVYFIGTKLKKLIESAVESRRRKKAEIKAEV